MHDIKFIRDNPDAFDAGLARRGLDPRAEEILALDKTARMFTVSLEEMQARRNSASKNIGRAKAQGDNEEFDRLRRDVETIKSQMPIAEQERDKHLAALTSILETVPNLPAAETPEGLSEDDNVEIRRWGHPETDDNAKEHYVLGEALGQMDFETAAKMSGSRFVLLKGALARLERALGNFMVDVQTGEFGYKEVSPPVLVRDTALYGTGQLPKFEQDLFRTTGDHYLIPTAEVSLTSMVANAILSEDELPLRLTAWTQCFRSEAGSAGRDTRGMIRVHQFQKVELVSITTPETSNAEHERMTDCAEAILKKLELPFRTLALSCGDMGFQANKTYDLEVWLPGQGKYREISSCSNCDAFQARRMKARYRPHGDKATRFVHTLNGSGLAVGRTLVGVIENYQQSDGSIAIPPVLQPYMGGLDRIAPEDA